MLPKLVFFLWCKFLAETYFLCFPLSILPQLFLTAHILFLVFLSLPNIECSQFSVNSSPVPKIEFYRFPWTSAIESTSLKPDLLINSWLHGNNGYIHTSVKTADALVKTSLSPKLVLWTIALFSEWRLFRVRLEVGFSYYYSRRSEKTNCLIIDFIEGAKHT